MKGSTRLASEGAGRRNAFFPASDKTNFWKSRTLKTQDLVPNPYTSTSAGSRVFGLLLFHPSAVAVGLSCPPSLSFVITTSHRSHPAVAISVQTDPCLPSSEVTHPL